MRLLSPQHFLVACNQAKIPYQSFMATQHWDRKFLRWGPNGCYKKTVYNSIHSNVPTFYTVPSTKALHAFAANFDDAVDDALHHVVFQSAIEDEAFYKEVQEDQNGREDDHVINEI